MGGGGGGGVGGWRGGNSVLESRPILLSGLCTAVFLLLEDRVFFSFQNNPKHLDSSFKMDLGSIPPQEAKFFLIVNGVPLHIAFHYCPPIIILLVIRL